MHVCLYVCHVCMSQSLHWNNLKTYLDFPFSPPWWHMSLLHNHNICVWPFSGLYFVWKQVFHKNQVLAALLHVVTKIRHTREEIWLKRKMLWDDFVRQQISPFYWLWGWSCVGPGREGGPKGTFSPFLQFFFIWRLLSGLITRVPTQSFPQRCHQ